MTMGRIVLGLKDIDTLYQADASQTVYIILWIFRSAHRQNNGLG